jgi:hypothetical protein
MNDARRMNRERTSMPAALLVATPKGARHEDWPEGHGDARGWIHSRRYAWKERNPPATNNTTAAPSVTPVCGPILAAASPS